MCCDPGGWANVCCVLEGVMGATATKRVWRLLSCEIWMRRCERRKNSLSLGLGLFSTKFESIMGAT